MITEVFVTSGGTTAFLTSTATRDLTSVVTEQVFFAPVFRLEDQRFLKVLGEVHIEWAADSRATVNCAVSMNRGSTFSETKQFSQSATSHYRHSSLTFDVEGRDFVIALSSDSGSRWRLASLYALAERRGRP